MTKECPKRKSVIKAVVQVCDFCAIVFNLMCVELAEGHEGIVKSKQISDPKMVA